MLASLNHPNVATIYGLELSEDVHYLVMELVSGPMRLSSALTASR